MEFATKTNESNCVNFASHKASSWPVLHGSLNDTVNCESSFSPVDSDGNSASPKSPLVLRRPSIDCGPCEIKISFEQKHEIRQVYVKSTARVYEIYYAADTQSMNEYLCTVRCGIAAKTEEFLANESLQNMGAATSISPSSAGSNELSRGLKTCSGDEDGWVEIKDPDSSLTEDGDSSCSNKTAVPVERENQDFYEATAEISDANPCTSMTIRLLSLQNAESACVDEIYVFADPVESDDNSTPKEVESSSANPMMSMLIPTLLQLSKSRTNHISDLTPNSKRAEHDVSEDKKSSSGSTSTSTCAKIQKEEIQSVSVEQETVTSKLERPSRSLKAPAENLNDHIGKTLDQLVYRIARIEQYFLSFEQRMINPITSMDTRLGEVEQQLKLLNEKIQLSEMHSSTGNQAPDISRNDSEFSSFQTDDNNCKDESSLPFVITAPEFSNSSISLENDACCSEEVANTVPGLVVTAPEFSYGEEDGEENVDDSVFVGGFPNEKLKKPLSIDDALADALAGFVSSTLNQDITITHDDDDSEKAGAKIIASHLAESDELDASFETSIDIVAERREHDAILFGTSSEPITLEEENALYLSVDDVKSECAQAEEMGIKEDDTSSFEPNVELIAGHDHTSVEESDLNLYVDDVKNESAQAEETGVNGETPWKVNSSSGETVMTEDKLNAIFDLPIQSTVDYKIPILDVKFESRDSSNLSSSIEALLTQTPETDTETNNGVIAVEDDSAEVDNSEVILLEASNHLLVDLGQDDSTYKSHNNSNEEASVPLF